MSFPNTPTPTAIRLMRKRRTYKCEVEGCDNPPVQAHHCLYRKDKRYPELNADENLQLVCYECHFTTGKARSAENREAFWNRQCERLGHNHMVGWHDSLPMKTKEYVYQ